MSGNILNVLVVVDVQNCFMNNVFGEDANSNILNQDNMMNCINLVNEISELTKQNDITVFTRDLHPLNHISFGDDKDKPEKDLKNTEGRVIDQIGEWPIHCRNFNQECPTRPDNIENKTVKPADYSNYKMTYTQIIEKLPEEYKTTFSTFLKTNFLSDNVISGNLLSYFYYLTDLKDIIYNLNDKNLNGIHKIGMSRSMNENLTEVNNIKDIGDFNEINITAEPYKFEQKSYITLTKGERCDQESYSAFNYHVNYLYNNENIVNKTATQSNPIMDPNFDSLQKKNSTGLFEWILKNKGDANNINVTVCGLVGNVCVMHSVIQGITLWDKIYQSEYPDITMNINFSLLGTLFLPGGLPPGNSVKPTIEDLFNPDLKGTAAPFSFLEWMKIKYPPTATLSFEDFKIKYIDNKNLFVNYKSQQGGKKYKKCPKCKKNPYHGGKCFICGFIPFLGKTKTQKRGKGRKGKKTRKNKRRFTRKTRRSF
jgi:nicotinamidase-related amidase